MECTRDRISTSSDESNYNPLVRRLLAHPRFACLRRLEITGSTEYEGRKALLQEAPALRELECLQIQYCPRDGSGLDGFAHFDGQPAAAVEPIDLAAVLPRLRQLSIGPSFFDFKLPASLTALQLTGRSSNTSSEGFRLTKAWIQAIEAAAHSHGLRRLDLTLSMKQTVLKDLEGFLAMIGRLRSGPSVCFDRFQLVCWDRPALEETDVRAGERMRRWCG